MNVLPYRTGLARADIGKIWTGTFRTEQFRSLVREITFGGRTPKYLVRTERPYLLGMTITTPIGHVHLAPLRLQRSQRLHPGAGRCLRQFHPGQYAHHPREAGVDQRRAARDQDQLVHETVPWARKGSARDATPPRP